MKRFLPTILLAIFLLVPPISPLAQDKPPSWPVYFSPHGGCTDAIIKELNGPNPLFWFRLTPLPLPPICQGLLNAHKRGVKVEVILDKINIGKEG